MVRDTLLNGISDFDIRREILETTEILTTAVNNVIALVDSKEMARNAIPTPDVSAASAFRLLKATIICKNCRSSSRNSSAANPSKLSPCPICEKQFHLHTEGPRGWNTKPNCRLYYVAAPSLAISRHPHQLPSQTSGLLENTGHFGAATKTAPPLLEEQVKNSLQKSESFENAHYVFQNGQ